jgi:hypothetical protein
MPRVKLPKLVALVALALPALASCKPRVAPCTAALACKYGDVCRAGRCVPEGSEPPPEAQRIVVTARDIAVVARGTPNERLSDEIPLGSPLMGTVVLLLRFPAPWGNRARIVSAFLTLEPSPGSSASPLALSVARIEEPWSPSSVSWQRLPRLSSPLAFAEIEAGPPRVLRIDVLSAVRGWASGQANDQGLAVMASAKGAEDRGADGASYGTGVAGTRGPRLDVYFR